MRIWGLIPALGRTAAAAVEPAGLAAIALSAVACACLPACSPADDAPQPRSPLLKELSVEGAARDAYPGFEPERNHYALHPTAADWLSVTAATVEPTDWISVGGRDWSQGTARVEVGEIAPGDDLVVSVANRSGELNHYVVHYLPENFPELQISRHDEDVTDELLFFVPKHRQPPQGCTSFLTIADNDGVPHQLRSVDGCVFDFQLQPDGRFSYSVRTGVNAFGVPTWQLFLLEGLDGEPMPVSAVGLSHTDGHDFRITEEDNYLFISYDNVVRDMSAYGLSPEENVGDSVIQETTPAGEVVWQWRSWGNIDFADCPAASEEPANWAHLNSLWLTADHAVIGSFRKCSQVLKIRRDTGEVVWRLGGSSSSFELSGDPFGEFCGQHSASETPDGGLLLFDNGIYCSGDREASFGQFSRVVEYALDPQAGQAVMRWDHSLDDGYTELAQAQGGVQRLPNGHVVIAWGWGPSTSVTELDREGHEIYRLAILNDGHVGTTYRALRYPGYAVVLDPDLPDLPE